MESRLHAAHRHSNVHERTGRRVRERQQTCGHVLNDSNAKMFIDHSAETNARGAHLVNHGREWCIDAPLNMILDHQFFGKALKSRETLFVGIVTTAANQSKPQGAA